MKTISRYIMTLALLLTAVTGAWADGTVTVTWTEADLTGSGSDLTTYTKDGVTIKCGDRLSGGKSFNGPVTISTTLGNFTKIEITGQGSAPIQSDIFTNDGNTATWTGNASSLNFPNAIAYATQFVFTIEPAEPDITVEWDASTKTGTFKMPGSDVVLTPIYAKAAAFATTGTGPEANLPAAAEGVIAGTDDPLIAENTGIVANIGETTTAQGTLMYAIGNSATQVPDLDDFSATVPTAENVADDGGDVYVWYYIQGANAPEGQTATLDNTFDDTEPACLTVQVLTNKFDITLNAANDNTIEAGKATVTVGGAAATVTDGKLQGVKMGSEVKLKAATGYKFRKVEVKKGAEAATPTLAEATAEDYGKVVCAAGHLHDAKTAVPAGCTAVGILGKVTTTGHGLILALQDAAQQNWNTINGWGDESYAGTTLKVLPDAARSTNLASYTTLGETAVSNWAVAQKSDYDAIFTNLGSTTGNNNGYTYDDNVNAYITTGVGGTEIDGWYWSATDNGGNYAWYFRSSKWSSDNKGESYNVRPVLGF